MEFGSSFLCHQVPLTHIYQYIKYTYVFECMINSSGAPTQQEYLEIEATAAYPDDHSQRHYCIPTYPKDMEGLVHEPTAAHPDDHS